MLAGLLTGVQASVRLDVPGAEAMTPAHAVSAEDEATGNDAPGLIPWLLRARWWRELPERPDPPILDDVSSDRMTATWTPPSSTAFPITDYDLQYRASEAAEFQDWDHAGTATQATIQGLDADTTYDVRVRAASELGAGDWSEASTATTTDATPRFAEGDNATREIAENTPADQAVGAPLTATGGSGTLRYSLEGADAGAFAIDGTTGQVMTRGDADYDFETQPRYGLTAVATDPAGGTAHIAVSVVVTDVDEPPGAPGTPEAASVASTNVNVRWAAPENTGPPITDYDVEYRQFGEDFVDAEYDGTAPTLRITGLTRATLYQVRVRATNAEGTGPWSARGSVRTAGRGGGGGGGRWRWRW